MFSASHSSPGPLIISSTTLEPSHVSSGNSSVNMSFHIWVVVSDVFYFHPENLGKMNPFYDEHIFQLGGSTTNQILFVRNMYSIVSCFAMLLYWALLMDFTLFSMRTGSGWITGSTNLSGCIHVPLCRSNWVLLLMVQKSQTTT